PSVIAVCTGSGSSNEQSECAATHNEASPSASTGPLPTLQAAIRHLVKRLLYVHVRRPLQLATEAGSAGQVGVRVCVGVGVGVGVHVVRGGGSESATTALLFCSL